MRALCLFVILLIFVICFATDLKQEGARVRSCNTKYVSECYSITRRLGRGEPYKTNLTAVTRYPWGNNVTLKVVLYTGVPIEIVKSKLCELPNIEWVWEYAQSYSNVDGNCPYKPGVYGFYNMEFKPKKLPETIRSLLHGKFHASFMFIVTKTEEIIIENSVIFYTQA